MIQGQVTNRLRVVSNLKKGWLLHKGVVGKVIKYVGRRG
jgi:hypothetical protein